MSGLASKSVQECIELAAQSAALYNFVTGSIGIILGIEEDYAINLMFPAEEDSEGFIIIKDLDDDWTFLSAETLRELCLTKFITRENACSNQ